MSVWSRQRGAELVVVRLYLSSFRLGDHSDRLLGLAGDGRRLALIGNALDGLPVDVRRAGVQREIVELSSLGFRITEADLREPEATRHLAAADVIWVRGGNVFVLRRLLADSGADSVIVELLERDAVVYAGYSSGACVLAPDLHDLERVDDVTAVTSPIYDGLGVLDRPVVPHVDSPGHPESDACNAVSASMTRAGRAHWALADGDVLLQHGNIMELLMHRAASQ
jgi:dipeptidase E